MKDRTTHIISVVIIAILAGSTIWWMKHSYDHDLAADHYIEHIKDYPLLDPALPFYERENLIVNVQELRDYLKGLPEQNKDWADMSVYFEVMNTGANISVNPDLKIWPASLTKLPVAMIAMKKVERGEWTMDQQFTMDIEDVDLLSQPQVVSQIGKSFPLSFILERLLLESDNSAFKMISSELTKAELDSIGEEVGLDELFTMDSKLSAKEYTRLLRALHSSTYLDHKNSQKLLSLLNDSKFDKFLKAGVPDKIPVAHKWGVNYDFNVYADSGIIYTPDRPYIISVMIQGKSNDQKADQARAELLMKEVSERAYQFMSK